MSGKHKSDEFDIHDRVEELRTEYLRELGGLSKIFVTLSIATLSLTLSLLGPNLSVRTGVAWMVATWIALVITAVLGFVQLYLFSNRSKSRADYLWTSHLVDVTLQFKGPEEQLDEFISRSDTLHKRFNRRSRQCALLVLFQGIFFLLALALFACFIYSNLRLAA